MSYYVIGTEVKKGTYQGHNYEHFLVYCTYIPDFSPCPDLVGSRCDVIKIKRDIAKFVDSVKVGQYYRFYYDRFGNVCDLVLDREKNK